MKLCEAESCTGCSACYNACPHDAIDMIPDREGFLQPRIQADRCIECGLCAKVCPILHPNASTGHTASPRTYVAWASDQSIRRSSSSGGIFSVLAKYVLAQGGVVFGASIDDRQQVRHIPIGTEEELHLLRGSKYVQSDIAKTYREAKRILIQGGWVLFSGTPCQIAGLRAFLRKPFDHLLTVDILCHGVPSPAFLDKTTRMLQTRGYHTHCTMYFRDLASWKCSIKYGSVPVRNKDDVYMPAFLKGINFRESCYRCPFASIPRQGDITIGDFWGIGRQTPFKGDVSHGASCVLVNSAKGETVWHDVAQSVFAEERTLSEAKEENPNIYRASERPPGRTSFYRDASSLSEGELIEKYGLRHPPKTFRQAVSSLLQRLRLGGVVKIIKRYI